MSGYATASLESGADLKTTSELTGHANTRITMEICQHVSDERKRETTDRIGERLLAPEPRAPKRHPKRSATIK